LGIVWTKDPERFHGDLALFQVGYLQKIWATRLTIPSLLIVQLWCREPKSAVLLKDNVKAEQFLPEGDPPESHLTGKPRLVVDILLR